jgi:hypothetical protein
MSEQSMIEEQARARRAQEWLDNQIYKESWQTLRMKALEALESLPLQDAAGREEIHHMLSVMKKVQRLIERAVEDGKIATLELERQKTGLRRFLG